MTQPAAMLNQRQHPAAATLIRPTTTRDQPAPNQRTSVGDQKLIGNSPGRHWLVTLNTAVAIFIVGTCAAPILAALRWSSAADTLRKRKYHAPYTSTDLARVPKDSASAQQARSPSGVHE